MAQVGWFINRTTSSRECYDRGLSVLTEQEALAERSAEAAGAPAGTVVRLYRVELNGSRTLVAW